VATPTTHVTYLSEYGQTIPRAEPPAVQRAALSGGISISTYDMVKQYFDSIVMSSWICGCMAVLVTAPLETFVEDSDDVEPIRWECCLPCGILYTVQ